MASKNKPSLSALLNIHFLLTDKEFSYLGELLDVSTAVSDLGVLPGLLAAAQLQLNAHGLPIDLGFRLEPDEDAIMGFRATFDNDTPLDYPTYYFRYAAIIEAASRFEFEPNMIYCDNLKDLFDEPDIALRITDSDTLSLPHLPS